MTIQEVVESKLSDDEFYIGEHGDSQDPDVEDAGE